jgi:uncharacterized protein (DUF2237 family)
VVLEATHEKTLEHIPIGELIKHAHKEGTLSDNEK